MPKIIFRPNPTPPPFVPPTPPTPQSTIRFATYPVEVGENSYYLHNVVLPDNATGWALQYLLLGVESWETYTEYDISSFANDTPIFFYAGSPSSEYVGFRLYYLTEGSYEEIYIDLTLVTE